MYKRQFISEVAAKTNMTSAQVGAVLSACSEVAVEQLVNTGEVRVPGIATLKVLKRSGRTARNPKTGQACAVEAGHTIKSRPVETLAADVKSKLPT